jgi:DNA-binding CsgD family transcriptional regulator
MLGSSIHTVRTQIKSVFAKTGTRRQGELVALLMQGVLANLETEKSR